MNEADRKRLLKIWSRRPFEGPNYASKDELEEIVIAKLFDFAIALDANNFSWPAKAIAGFLLKETRTLNEAFGFNRGRASSKETLQKDADVLQELFMDVNYSSIAEITGVDRSTVSGLCEGKEKFVKRRDRALIELLGRRLKKGNAATEE